MITSIVAVGLGLICTAHRTSAANITLGYQNINSVQSLDNAVLSPTALVWFGSWNTGVDVANVLSSYLQSDKLAAAQAALNANFTLGQATTYSALGDGADPVLFTISDVGLVLKNIDMVFWKGTSLGSASEAAALRWNGKSFPDGDTLDTNVAFNNALASNDADSAPTALFGSAIDSGTDGVGTITTTPGIAITSGDPIPGVKNSLYPGYTITADGATSFSVTGTLPIGFEINSATGEISGTTRQTGPFNVTLNAVLANQTLSKAVTFVINDPIGSPPIVEQVTAQTAYRGVPFTLALNASGSPTLYKLTGAPFGLAIDDSGVITGTTVLRADTYPLKVLAFGNGGTSAEMNFDLILTAPSLVASQTTITGAKDSLITPVTFSTVPPNISVTFTISSRPGGLSFDNATGEISGIPTETGVTTNTTVIATLSGSVSAKQILTFNIVGPRPALIAPAAGSLEATRGTPYSLVIQRSANGAGTPITYSPVGGTDLKTIGLDLASSNGVISGTPSKLGIFPLSVAAINPSGTSNILEFNISVDAATPLISGEMNRGAGVAIPFRHAFVSNDKFQEKNVTGLPPGLTFLRNVRLAAGEYDLISGVPTQAGSFPVTLNASTTKRDGTPLAAEPKTLTIRVDDAAPNPAILGVRPGTFRLGVPTRDSFSPAEGFFLTGTDLGTSSTVYMNATRLPPGLGFGKTWDGSGYIDGSTSQKSEARRRGLITGTPTQAGIYPITLFIQNGKGYTKSSLILTVNP